MTVEVDVRILEDDRIEFRKSFPGLREHREKEMRRIVQKGHF